MWWASDPVANTAEDREFNVIYTQRKVGRCEHNPLAYPALPPCVLFNICTHYFLKKTSNEKALF